MPCGCNTPAVLQSINAKLLSNFTQLANNDKYLNKLLVLWSKNPCPATVAAVNKRLNALKIRFLADFPSSVDPDKFNIAVTFKSKGCQQIFSTKTANPKVINAINQQIANYVKGKDIIPSVLSGTVQVPLAQNNTRDNVATEAIYNVATEAIHTLAPLIDTLTYIL